jgi:membrane associated rhomboid family serine protease
MVDVEAGGNGPSVVVAGCPACRLAWFDADGVRRLTPDPPARFRRGRAGPGDVAEVLGRYALSRRQDAVAESGIDLASRDGLSAWVGLPTLHGTPRIDARPWATYGLVAACVTTWAATLITGFVTRGFLGALDVQRAVIEAAGFIPAYPGRHAGLTWVTSTFVHAGMLHLVANMYALLLTGPHVEGRLGPWRFLGLFFAADVAGTTFDLMLHGASWVPRVGASGGIAGLFGYFVFAFPRVDVGTYVPNWRSGTRYSFTRIRVAVPWMFALWLWFEVLGILRGPQTRIAFAAHVGGALAGIGGWALARAVRRPGTIPPPVLPPIPRARDRRFPSAIPVTAPAAVGPAPPPTAGTATSESLHGFVLEPEAPRPSRAPPGEAPSPPSAWTSTH